MMITTDTATRACYVYGIITIDGVVPAGLRGIEGDVRTVRHRDVAAIVGDLSRDRVLGHQADLLSHERVVDSVAASTTILPMRFAAVVESERGLVDELLDPYHDQLAELLAELAGRLQLTLRGEYEHDEIFRELLVQEPAIRSLREELSRLGEAVSYPQRLRHGELVVKALEQRRAVDGERVYRALAPHAVDVSHHQLASPDEIIDSAFLVETSHQRKFEKAAENIGRDLAGRVRFWLLGPQPVYDFVPRM